MHQIIEWCSFSAHVHSVGTVVAIVLLGGADIATDCERCDFVWFSWRFEHQNKVIRTLFFRMTFFPAYIAVKPVCSSSLERRCALHFNVTAFSTLAALHILETELIKVVIDSAAVLASPL
jgi:hypothetical protein